MCFPDAVWFAVSGWREAIATIVIGKVAVKPGKNECSLDLPWKNRKKNYDSLKCSILTCNSTAIIVIESILVTFKCTGFSLPSHQ